MSKILKFITNFGCSSPTNEEEISNNATESPIVTQTPTSPRLNLEPEQIQRFKKYMQYEPDPDMKEIPRDIVGLGYTWYPIVIFSKNSNDLTEFIQTMKLVIRPCINSVRGADMTKEVKYDEDQVIKEISNDAVFVGRRPLGHHLGVKPRFFDPQEVIDAIDYLKHQKNTYFVGLMEAMDLIQLTVSGDDYYLTHINCRTPGQFFTKDKKWKIKCGIYPRFDNESRIFNWLLKISVKFLGTRIINDPLMDQ